MIKIFFALCSVIGTIVFFFKVLERAHKQGYDDGVQSFEARQIAAAFKVSDISQKRQAKIEEQYANIKVPDVWPADGIVHLEKDSLDPSLTTSTDMQLDRD